jgi:hypothetical protein
MGILLVYDITDEASFNNIRNWMRNIEQHASDNVNKVHLLHWCLHVTCNQLRTGSVTSACQDFHCITSQLVTTTAASCTQRSSL